MVTGGTVLCLVADDGHVPAFSADPSLDERISFDHAVMTEVGVTGFRLEHLPLDDAAALHIASLACQGCLITLPCGCGTDIKQLLACPHGAVAAIQAAGERVAERIGYGGLAQIRAVARRGGHNGRRTHTPPGDGVPCASQRRTEAPGAVRRSQRKRTTRRERRNQ